MTADEALERLLRSYTQYYDVVREDVERLTGYAAGGVCPFLAPADVPVWLDVSLKDHETVYPAAGNAHSGVALSPEELEGLTAPAGWCDVCKPLEVAG